MITINGQETDKYVLDLNESEQSKYSFSVASISDAGRKTKWYVDTQNSNYVDVNYNGDGNFTATFDLENISNELKIYVKNTKKESVEISVLPNIEMSSEKDYTFTCNDYTISGNTMVMNLISLENGKETPWRVEYDGKPLSYAIAPMQSSGSSSVSILCMSKFYGEYTAMIKLKQSPSELCLRIYIHHVDNTIADVQFIEGCDISR